MLSCERTAPAKSAPCKSPPAPRPRPPRRRTPSARIADGEAKRAPTVPYLFLGMLALPLPKAPRPGPAGRHDPPHSSAIQPFPRWNCRELFDNRCCDYRKKPSLPAATRPYTFGLMSHLSAQKPLTVEDDTVGSLVNDAEPADRMRLWLQPGDGPRPTSRNLRWLHVSTNDGEWSTCTVLTVGSGIAAAYVFHRKAAQPSLPRSGSDQSW